MLFIMVDDLRPQLGCYGDTIVKSPHIDRLATEGIVFKRAYCQQALCSPSRTSLLTGRYPETTQVFDITTHFRRHLPDVITLPQRFKQEDYQTVGLNKIFHLVGFEPQLFGDLDDTASWTIPHWVPTRSGWGPEGEVIYQQSRATALKNGPLGYGNIPRSLAYEAPNVPDSSLSDGETAQEALRQLRKLSQSDQPFFLAVGFYKPHLPFVAPKKYWELYDPKMLQLPKNQFFPKNAPTYAGINLNELRSYTNIPKTGEIDPVLGKALLHGYLACISYVDAQIGLVLAELDSLGLRDNTIVVLLGDHGFQVGEHGFWGTKHTNFETSTHTPLIISAPKKWIRNKHVKPFIKTESIVELVDVYPTLLEMTGLPPDIALEGESLVKFFKNPKAKGKTAALSVYPKDNRMGRSIRTDRYRLTAWQAKDGSTDYELYDHQTDPQENENVASSIENQAVLKKLQRLLSKKTKYK
ncbi:MAG: sulfatase [Runella sp.]